MGQNGGAVGPRGPAPQTLPDSETGLFSNKSHKAEITQIAVSNNNAIFNQRTIYIILETSKHK